MPLAPIVSRSSLPACVGCLFRVGWGIKRVMRQTGFAKTTVHRYGKMHGLIDAAKGKAKKDAFWSVKGTKSKEIEALEWAWRQEWRGIDFLGELRHWACHPACRQKQRFSEDQLRVIRERSRARHHRLKHDPEYRAKKSEQIAEWKKNNVDRVKDWSKRWRASEAGKRFLAAYRKQPHNRAASNVRKRLRDALNGRRADLPVMGCTRRFFRAYIEARFKEGMSWDNYGKAWQIDHVIPIASFDLSKPKQRTKVNHFTNLQPMWTQENCAKSDNVDTQSELASA